MIGYIKGYIKYKGRGYIVVGLNSVGYKVEVVRSIFLKDQQSEIEVFIYPDLTERGTRLFGFESPQEVFLFERLKAINGVGPRAALNIVSSADYDSLSDVFDRGDVSFLSSIPGIGKKTAERIIFDLKGKIDIEDDMNKDIRDTLLKLGYSKKEISSIYSKIKDIESVEDAIKEALKLLSKG